MEKVPAIPMTISRMMTPAVTVRPNDWNIAPISFLLVSYDGLEAGKV
jgi:hypothetical protein